jgi:hypothetical protein
MQLSKVNYDSPDAHRQILPQAACRATIVSWCTTILASSTDPKSTPPSISHKTTEHIVSWNVNVARKPSSVVLPKQHAKLSVSTVGTHRPTHVAGNRSFDRRSNAAYRGPSSGQALSRPACLLSRPRFQIPQPRSLSFLLPKLATRTLTRRLLLAPST